jgi:hypothetical protein
MRGKKRPCDYGIGRNDVRGRISVARLAPILYVMMHHLELDLE